MDERELFLLDLDKREAELRRRVYDEADFWANVPEDPTAIVATYFIRARYGNLTEAGEAISYHMTSATKHPEPGSLVAQCTGSVAGVRAWDAQQTVGLVRVAFPVKQFERADGAFSSTDLLHIAAGAGILALWDFAEAKLLDLNLPQSVIAGFPGPAYGCHGVTQLTNWPEDEPAFGTILKPTAGITPEEVADLVGAAAQQSLFLFIKEDENLFPELPYSPAGVRTRLAAQAIEKAKSEREGRGLLFCPHITAPPDRLLRVLDEVLEAGATGVMFSEQYLGGATRLVRDHTKHLPEPPVIYGHNGGIDARTLAIWREVLDLLARLDGIDFRQTAPVALGHPLLRPQGLEWRKSEAVFTRPIEGIKPVMVTRAGGLDQGNIIHNLEDVADHLCGNPVLFLAGSAINSIKGPDGKADPTLGAAAMRQAVELWKIGEAPEVSLPPETFFRELVVSARKQCFEPLLTALAQRYPEYV